MTEIMVEGSSVRSLEGGGRGRGGRDGGGGKGREKRKKTMKREKKMKEERRESSINDSSTEVKMCVDIVLLTMHSVQTSLVNFQPQ